ncbi:2-hydroxyacyl-CoA dehydratase subunit D [Papillibacter cinnamivorans]|uniref:Benzoyl-CoA reductase, subunit C n=1 Tax=Papillibacter cinnamivorans DSM 12816 TaxID=1122930 RepID=A0A1W2BB15_9FIRM|nr:2-hydroxyacyl-CoA dehydratase family protein [Papillibacter cinnamivorans]SMC69960.1 benzoyl-CoA reductase, subunit C [Papillibacter cinnamivorans DSM 12816]
MSVQTEIYSKMESAIKNIKSTLEENHKKGVRNIGVLPVYAPEELVHALGMFPVGLWGGKASISKASRYLPPFACSIMQTVMEYGMGGVYDALDGALMSTPCDTLKCVTQNWLSACPHIPAVTVVYPQNNKVPSAAVYLEQELLQAKEALEKIAGRKLSEQALAASIEVYNENRKAMQRFFDVVSEKPGCISAKHRHLVAKSRFFLPKEEHTRLVSALCAELENSPEMKWKGSRVVLAGIMAEPDGLLELFDEFGMAVVGDELAQEYRQYRTLVPAGKTGLSRLALQWQDTGCCSLVYDPEKRRSEYMADMAKRLKADGAVICMMKFCDPEEFDYPWLKAALDKAGIPSLNLEVDLNTPSLEQARTRLQAFSEQLAAI